MLQQYFTRKNVLYFFGTISILTIASILYGILHFHVTSTTPNLSRVATSTSEITYTLSQPIESVETVLFSETDITGSVEIQDKRLTIPVEELEKDTEYTITINGLRSKWLNKQTISINSKFTPEYIDFSDLSKEQQKAQIDNSNSGQVDDPFISNNTFPIFNRKWQIEATVVNSDRIAILTISFFEEVPDYDNGGKVKQVSNDMAEQYRREAFNEITKRGGDPDNYKIVYKTNRYLNEKYSAEQYHD